MPLRLGIKTKLEHRSESVKSVDLHPTEPWILVSLFTGSVCILDYKSQTMTKSFEVTKWPVRSAKFIARRQWVVAGADDKYIRVYDYNTMEKVKEYEAHTRYIICVAVHPTLPYVLSSSGDMLIKLWDWENDWVCTQTFNPVTKDYTKLPDLKPALLFKEGDNRKVEYRNFDTRFLFDPSVSLSYKVIRFVYRSVHDRYRRLGIENQSQIYIYSSSESAGSWRLSTSIAGYQMFATNSGVFLNGVMYWVTAGTDLLCFDAEKNSVWFKPLPLNPKPKFKDRRVFYFGKCGGRLCLIEKLARTYLGLSDLTLYDGFDIMEMTTEDAR